MFHRLLLASILLPWLTAGVWAADVILTLTSDEMTALASIAAQRG